MQTGPVNHTFSIKRTRLHKTNIESLDILKLVPFTPIAFAKKIYSVRLIRQNVDEALTILDWLKGFEGKS